jgi:hypothetical protein
MAELVCPTHGPYDASYGTCPYCSGHANRPPAPSPLEEDDLPTDFGNSFQGGSWTDDDLPTDLGGERRSSGGYNDDDVDPTELGFEHHMDDATEIDYDDMSALAILWVKEGGRRGRIYRIKDGDTVGRKEGGIIIDDPKVSNPHAKFTLENDVFVVWDFGSRNGTTVNGERIRAATPLKENDTVKFGDTIMVLKILE